MQGAVHKHGRAAARRWLAGIIGLAALAGSSAVFGQGDDNSPLRKFERSAQPPPSSPSQPAPPPPSSPRQGDQHQENLGDDLASDLFGGIVNATLEIVVDVGALTLKRLDPGADGSARRDDGEIMIPFIRYDFSRQSVSGAIFALDNRVEAGYGPVGAMFEKYAFFDKAASLTFYRQMLLYRASASKDFELDLGFGQTVMYGTLRTPLGSFSIPVKARVADSVTVEFIPTWSGTINDYEAAVHWGRQYASLKVGYRHLSSPAVNLKGPFAGFALYF